MPDQDLPPQIIDENVARLGASFGKVDLTMVSKLMLETLFFMNSNGEPLVEARTTLLNSVQSALDEYDDYERLIDETTQRGIDVSAMSEPNGSVCDLLAIERTLRDMSPLQCMALLDRINEMTDMVGDDSFYGHALDEVYARMSVAPSDR